MSVVAKMQCGVCPQGNEITEQTQSVSFGAVWQADEGERVKPENAIFGNATPWGSIQMGIANPTAKEFFKPGKSYYVTFTEAPD